MAWRFNSRDNSYLARDTLFVRDALIRLIKADSLPYAELIAESVL